MRHEKASVTTTNCKMHVAAWGIKAEAAHGELSAPPWSSDVLFNAYDPFIAVLKQYRPHEHILIHTQGLCIDSLLQHVFLLKVNMKWNELTFLMHVPGLTLNDLSNVFKCISHMYGLVFY